jgi:hypothetical protein
MQENKTPRCTSSIILILSYFDSSPRPASSHLIRVHSRFKIF